MESGDCRKRVDGLVGTGERAVDCAAKGLELATGGVNPGIDRLGWNGFDAELGGSGLKDGVGFWSLTVPKTAGTPGLRIPAFRRRFSSGCCPARAS